MRNAGEIEDIEQCRLRAGIDDVELRPEIRGLHVGDGVKLTFLTGTTSFETLAVRITCISGSSFRGKLADRPVAPALSRLRVGSSVAFAAAHIHSLAKTQPAPPVTRPGRPRAVCDGAALPARERPAKGKSTAAAAPVRTGHGAARER